MLTLAVTLLAVDGTVLALAIPSPTESLNPSGTQLLWIGDAYAFALAGLLVTMGNLADRIGRKRLLLIGSVGFGVSSAIAAFAPTPELLIAARALLGISGATIMPSTLSLIRATFLDQRQRTRAIAIWSAGATGGGAIGPLVGGALLEHSWWGSVFLINIPVMVVVVALGVPLLTEYRNPARAPIDLRSALVSFLAIVPLVYAIKTVAADGMNLAVVGAALFGLAAGMVFVIRQRPPPPTPSSPSCPANAPARPRRSAKPATNWASLSVSPCSGRCRTPSTPRTCDSPTTCPATSGDR